MRNNRKTKSITYEPHPPNSDAERERELQISFDIIMLQFLPDSDFSVETVHVPGDPVDHTAQEERGGP